MEDVHWGTSLWKGMHTCSFAYPDNPTEDDKHHFESMILGIQSFLPCPKCQRHFAQMLQEHPIQDVWHSRDALTQWLVMLHNKVNQRLGKPIFSYEQAVKQYRPFADAQCSLPMSTNAPAQIQTTVQRTTQQTAEDVGIPLGAIAAIALLGLVIYLCARPSSNNKAKVSSIELTNFSTKSETASSEFPTPPETPRRRISLV